MNSYHFSNKNNIIKGINYEIPLRNNYYLYVFYQFLTNYKKSMMLSVKNV